MPPVATLTLVALLLAPLSAEAASSCSLRGFSTDPDPAGLNVRAEPSGSAAVVATLPPPTRDENEAIAAEMDIVGAENGWLLVEGAEFPDYGIGDPRPLFPGRGWVSGRLVGFFVQDGRVFERPSTSSRVVAETGMVGTAEEYIIVRRILDCDGAWAKVEAVMTIDDPEPGRPVRGWVRDTCANQVTTCN